MQPADQMKEKTIDPGRYRVLAIDLDDTILDFRANAAWSIEKAFLIWNLDYSSQVLNTFMEINEGFWERIEKGELSFEELRRIRWDTIFQALEITDVDGQLFEDTFRKHLNESHFLMPEADQALRKLSEIYELMIISNGADQTQKSRIQKAGIEDLFFDILSSEEAGYKKPDPRFFECMQQRISDHTGKTEKEEILIIGDSLAADIQGARRSGYPCVWLCPERLRHEKKNSSTQFRADFEAENWNELLSLLSGSD